MNPAATIQARRMRERAAALEIDRVKREARRMLEEAIAWRRRALVLASSAACTGLLAAWYALAAVVGG